MKPPQDWDENYVLNIPPGEYDWVEFKGSGLFPEGSDGNLLRSELSKQVSAFANSLGGGTIVLGIRDDKNGTRVVDDGGITLAYKRGTTKEWLEDIIPNLVEFPLGRFEVRPIVRSVGFSQIAEGKGLFLISVPPSEQAPHQAQDKRYYLRLGGKSQPLNHRSILDIVNRGKVYEPARRIVVTDAAKAFSTTFNAANHIIRHLVTGEGHLPPAEASKLFLKHSASSVESLRASLGLYGSSLAPEQMSQIAIILHRCERVLLKLAFFSEIYNPERDVCDLIGEMPTKELSGIEMATAELRKGYADIFEDRSVVIQNLLSASEIGTLWETAAGKCDRLYLEPEQYRLREGRSPFVFDIEHLRRLRTQHIEGEMKAYVYLDR